MKIEIYDTTLREGSQRSGVFFSEYEKAKVAGCLDILGIDYIEAGFFGPSTADALCRFAKKYGGSLKAGLSVLCATCRPGSEAGSDPLLRKLAESDFGNVAIVGKASLFQVSTVLGTSPSTNLDMIRSTVSFLKQAGKRVIFDAEHFFDGWSFDPEYTRSVLEAAASAGADRIVLCDTNGGMLPDVISITVESVKKITGGVPVGIHCHNDIGMADACSVAAVLAGASHVQCTVSGIGERCGNANLSTVVPTLQLKLGFECVPRECMEKLAPVTRDICQTANLGFDECAPFVGGHSFLHKAGLHIDAVRKAPDSFEHIDPSLVGNRRSMIISELAGRSAISELLGRMGYEAGKNSPELDRVAAAIRKAESEGYIFDSSEASLYVLINKTLGTQPRPFEMMDYKLIFSADEPASSRWTAIVRFTVGGREQLRVGEGDGPVNALDIAAHRALSGSYRKISGIKMSDIKARIDANDSAASASTVRVFVETSDGNAVWRTMGASTDIIAASWAALLDAYEYFILHICGPSGAKKPKEKN